MRHASMKTSRFAAFVALLLALVSGCSNNPYPPGESYGNVLYRELADDIKSLDPTFSFTVDESYLCDLIYPSFYKYNYLKRNPFVLETNLGAAEPGRVALPDGGEEWTFTIKKGLRFADDPCFPGGKGRDITAAEFVYGFKRMVDPKAQFPLAEILGPKVVGWEDYAKGFDAGRKVWPDPNFDKELAGVFVDKADPYTFHVRLSEPYPQLRYIMAMHFTTPQAREAVETYGDEYARHPVGCGPYRMTEYKPKQRIALTINPNRHEDFYPTEGAPGDAEAGLLKDAGKRLPLTEKIVFNIIREGTSSWNLFMQGYLDARALDNNNYAQAVTGGMLTPEMQSKGIAMRKDTQMAVYYLAFNMADPTFGGTDDKHKKLRQAISLAVDSQEFIDIAKQGNGLAAQWMLPPGLFGADASWKNPYRQPDLARAKRLLAEAGYPDGKDASGEKLVLHFDNTATTAALRTQLGLLIRQIEKLGIKVEWRTTNANIFQDKLHKLQHQFIFYGWFADYPDPEDFLFLLYGPNAKAGSPNYALYKNPEFDRLFDRMKIMDDSPERQAIIARMRDLAVEDCCWIPLYHPTSVALGYDWLGNVKAHPLANDFNQYRSIDSQKRAERQRAWNRPLYWPILALVVLAIAGIIPAIGVIKRRTNRRVRQGDGGGA
jgi:ABC-type transport system substrate-binding protein